VVAYIRTHSVHHIVHIGVGVVLIYGALYMLKKNTVHYSHLKLPFDRWIGTVEGAASHRRRVRTVIIIMDALP
jgi:hypothetical protein